MAHNSVILALFLVAIIGLASAQSPLSSPTSTPVAFSPDIAASSPDTIGSIGNVGAVPSDDAVEAPVGAPVDAFVPNGVTPASAPTSGATMVNFSVAGLVLVITGYFF